MPGCEINITICMGSSCFSRGNNRNADIISRFIKDHNLQAKVALQGCLCEGNCSKGPNLRINGELFHDIQPDSLHDLLRHTLLKVAP